MNDNDNGFDLDKLFWIMLWITCFPVMIVIYFFTRGTDDED